jgi:hypothetical protein
MSPFQVFYKDKSSDQQGTSSDIEGRYSIVLTPVKNYTLNFQRLVM